MSSTRLTDGLITSGLMSTEEVCPIARRFRANRTDSVEGMLRRWLALVIIGLILAVPGTAMAQDDGGSDSDGSPPPQSVDAEDAPDEELPGLGKIIGSPDAGPDPQDAGDRGGWAQLALAGVLLVGVGFITFRIARGVRAINPP